MGSFRLRDKTEYSVIEKAARSPEGFFAVFLAVTEIIFSLFKFSFNIVFLGNKVFFAVIVGFFLGMIASLIPTKISRIISIVLSSLYVIYLLIQLIYSSVFKNYWSLSATGGFANQAFDYKKTILLSIGKEIIPFLLIIILLAFNIYCILFWIDYSIHKWEMYLLHVFIMGAGITYFIIAVSLQGEDKNSPKSLIRTYSSVELSVQKLGLVETMMRDGVYLIFEKDKTLAGTADTGFEYEAVVPVEDSENGYYYMVPADEESDTDKEQNKNKDEKDNIDKSEKENESAGKKEAAKNDKAVGSVKDNKKEKSQNKKDSTESQEQEAYKPHKLDINLSMMNSITTNSSVIELTNYIASTQPTFTNKYTGMFEGYNLIFITAEGFDGYVIDKDLTPELYKMSRNGFYFTNFYTPLWYGSTLGGEYANLTGLMPKGSGDLSMQKVGEQKGTMPFCLGNELKEKGYYVCAFHNNEYDYYDRDISRPCIGYDNYIGVYNGLEYEQDENGTFVWPQSDLFMEQHTFSKYCDSSPFHVYYLTVSGHLNYDFYGNAMSEKNRDKVRELPYSEKTRAYIACQLEFEYMLEALNKDLTKKGIADKTLIVICGDHVPYNDMEIVDELAGTTLDSFDRYRNTLIIYSASMDRPVRVDKPCSSLDILPTVLNLMGLEFDSRMLVGRDIFSDEQALVIMQDGSFITDKYRYNALTGEISNNGDYNVSDVELSSKLSIVSNRFRMADAICDLDYYSYIVRLKKEK